MSSRELHRLIKKLLSKSNSVSLCLDIFIFHSTTKCCFSSIYAENFIFMLFHTSKLDFNEALVWNPHSIWQMKLNSEPHQSLAIMQVFRTITIAKIFCKHMYM